MINHKNFCRSLAKKGVLIFLSSIESHSLRRMETPGPGPGCGLNLELSDYSIEWGYLVWDHDMEPVQHWGTQP